MLFKKKETWVILGICAGFVALSSLSFLNTRNALKSYGQATDADWTTLEAALGAQSEALAALEAEMRGHVEATVADEAGKARAALDAAVGPQAKAVADDALWRQAERLLYLAANVGGATIDAAAARLRDGHRQVETCAKRYNDTARQYEIKLRKNPDTRVVEGLRLKVREYFKAPEATATGG